MNTLRKPREEPPPAPYLRSCNGTPARVRKTSRVDITGRLWLYRLDYGDVVGSQEWTMPQLLQLADEGKLRWLQRCPSDLREIERALEGDE